ncbi:hypothetical protein ACIQC9_14215 [Brevundimonas sp. NPDC092305]|uniref:hypothetical protein n=1 Tax=Brevundimonas sp. NPDC092305 TaxID=3363957 RepID=UPI003806964E
MDRLNLRFPNGYLFRFQAAKIRASRQAAYADDDISNALETISDAAFGSTKRPVGFCRHANSGCSLAPGQKKTCSKTAGAACSLEKPDFLIVAYQAGPQSGSLLSRLYHSVLPIEIPERLYGSRTGTAEFLEENIARAIERLLRIKAMYGQGACPFLLPPLNFGDGKAVQKLLKEALQTENISASATEFRRSRWDKSGNYYIGRSGLKFAPAKGAARHGSASVHPDQAIALTKYYRLGCAFHDEFHWDVGVGGKKHLAGNYPFYCRCATDPDDRKTYPKSKHANVLIEDCLR